MWLWNLSGSIYIYFLKLFLLRKKILFLESYRAKLCFFNSYWNSNYKTELKDNYWCNWFKTIYHLPLALPLLYYPYIFLPYTELRYNYLLTEKLNLVGQRIFPRVKPKWCLKLNPYQENFLTIAMYVLKNFKIGKNSGCMLFEIQNFIFFWENFVPFVILLVSWFLLVTWSLHKRHISHSMLESILTRNNLTL